MPRTDPTDNGGLFIGRRPGTAPVKYRALPARGTRRRQAIDNWLAIAILVAMVFVSLLFFGPDPGRVAVDRLARAVRVDTVTVAIFVGFLGMLLTLLVGLRVLRRLDLTWILVRRAAGVDQREGVMTRVFAYTAALAAILFFGWLILIAGPGSSLTPRPIGGLSVGFLDYYKQFEGMPEEEVNARLREQAAERKRKALSVVEPIDLSVTTWPEYPTRRWSTRSPTPRAVACTGTSIAAPPSCDRSSPTATGFPRSASSSATAPRSCSARPPTR